MNGLLIIAHAPLASALRKCVLHVFPDAAETVAALDVLLLLALTRLGYRWLEALVAVLVLTIAACIGVELLLAQPVMADLLKGFVPTDEILRRPGMLFVALGIVGATVMPHNLYLHSSIVGQRAASFSKAVSSASMLDTSQSIRKSLPSEAASGRTRFSNASPW